MEAAEAAVTALQGEILVAQMVECSLEAAEAAVTEIFVQLVGLLSQNTPLQVAEEEATSEKAETLSLLVLAAEAGFLRMAQTVLALKIPQQVAVELASSMPQTETALLEASTLPILQRGNNTWNMRF